MTAPPERASARPTVAFLVDNLYDGFQEALWRSVAACAQEQDVNLLCFLGGSIIPRDQIASEERWGRNGVFELVHPENVDGVIALSASLGNTVGDDELEQFFSRFPLPLVSLGRSLPGRPSLMVDNAAGVRALVAHLVGVHGRRRLAFVAGPSTSADARQRLEAYRAALDEHGLPFDPALVYAGTFERVSGMKAVRAFLDERRVRFDALIGANDYTGIHAMAELSRRGIDVPGEIAVTGFDDLPDAADAACPLTTVRQPLDELGRRAVLTLLRRLRGEPIAALDVLATELVIRRSCGCAAAARPAPPPAVEPGRGALRLRLDEEARILSRITLPKHLSDRSYHETLSVELPALGIQSFFLCGFLDELGRRAELRTGYDLGGHLGLPPAPEGQPFPSARLLPAGFRPPVRHAHAVLPVNYMRERLGYALCELGPASPGIFEPLSAHTSSVTKFAALVREVGRHTGELEEQVAARTQELREAQRLLLDTARQAGMAEVAVGVLHNVGNLLNSVGVCAEAIRAHAELPLADGLERLVGLLAPYRQDLPGFFRTDPRAALIPEYLERLAADLRRTEGRARDEAQQLLDRISVIHDAIRGLQDLARRDRQAAVHEPVDLAEVAEAVLEIQRALLVRHLVQARLDVGRLPRVTTERSKLVHILVNLVKNAVEAMRDAPEAARFLTLTARSEEGGRVRLSVSDTGVGIRPEDLERIFSYGFTTKPDGHGFGLHSCALHVRELGGTLEVRSEGPGRGATFTLALPVEPTAAA